MLLVLVSFYTRSFLFSMAIKEISGMEYVNWGRGHSVHPPLSAGRGVEPPTKFSKKDGGLDRTSTFSGELLGKRGLTFRGGACNFLVKNKI